MTNAPAITREEREAAKIWSAEDFASAGDQLRDAYEAALTADEEEIAELRRERDELREALRSIKIITEGPTPHSPYTIADRVFEISSAALSKKDNQNG